MPHSIILAAIIGVALVLFINGRLPVDVVGLLVLAALALTGLVTPTEALAGFSSPAVVTVWAMFILSAGLSRTGVAYRIGQPLQRFAHSGEVTLIVALMIVSSLLSALINTTTVAVILLPTVLELTKRSGIAPSRLLMPMALGCLLGGPFTGISTPPNLLVVDIMQAEGITPFGIFDFTPITASIVAAGIIFMVLAGRQLLPKGKAGSGKHAAWETFYQLNSHIFSVQIPKNSPLVGRTLAESRLGSALYLTVVGMKRLGKLSLAPSPGEVLQAGDVLIVHGQSDEARRFHGSQHLIVAENNIITKEVSARLRLVCGHVCKGSELIGHTLAESSLRRDCHVNVLAVRSAAATETENGVGDPRRYHFQEGDMLWLQGEPEALDCLRTQELIRTMEVVRHAPSHGPLHLTTVQVPEGSVLAGRNLVDSRLGSAFGLTVVALLRSGDIMFMPSPEEDIRAGDTLVIQGQEGDMAVLRALQDLEVSEQSSQLAAELESQRIGVAEVLLSPRTTLAGRTLGDLRFREHYGLSVLAVWRKGHARREGLQDTELQFGDALLVYGPRQNLAAVAKDSDFVVLDREASKAPRLNKAPVAAGIMLAVLLTAIFGVTPVSIAAVTGAALMVVTGCVRMEEAYRAIEWKVVFLIASMLPLGVAVQKTGAATLGAEALIALVGHLGPRWVVAALFSVTVLGTQIIPTSALVVLMAPVALSAAAQLNISPQLLMMTVAIAASASFASPLSHPAHLLIMGPGGYRFMDYVKVGVPLTFIALGMAVWLLPIMF